MKWEETTIGTEFDLFAGGDVDREHFSETRTNIFRYPIYANALQRNGLYGFTSNPKYNGDSITITGRGDVGVPIYRDTDFDAIVRLLVLTPKPNGKADSRFTTYLIERCVNFPMESTGVPQLTVPQIRNVELILPPLSEQRRVAAVLSDTDELITALEKLIAKKRSIKQGAMQELLTGKQRLPGFNGDWMVTDIGTEFNLYAGGDVAKEYFSHVHTNTHTYPIYANALQNDGLYGYTSMPRYKGDSITITGRGDIGVAMYREIDFDAIVRLLVLTPKANSNVNSKFTTYFFNCCVQFPQESTGVPQLTVPQIRNVELLLPSLPEQTAIASILSDMDAEIDALTVKMTKLKHIKQGMMNELLSGRIRLIGEEKPS